MAKYRVYGVDSEVRPVWGEPALETDDLSEAQRAAREYGGAYGGCVYDTEREMIDVGAGFVPLDELDEHVEREWGSR